MQQIISQGRLRGHTQLCSFFSDSAGFGIEIVQALDAAHAEDIARAQHPTGRLSAVPAELLDGKDRHKLLAAECPPSLALPAKPSKRSAAHARLVRSAREATA